MWRAILAETEPSEFLSWLFDPLGAEGLGTQQRVIALLVAAGAVLAVAWGAMLLFVRLKETGERRSVSTEEPPTPPRPPDFVG